MIWVNHPSAKDRGVFLQEKDKTNESSPTKLGMKYCAFCGMEIAKILYIKTASKYYN